MPDFSIPLSGLTAESTALSAIANNLSNQNTTGYKDTSVLFSDLFYQSLGTTGSGDPIQVGAGVQVGSMPSLFTQGSVSATGVPTDVAIQGDGFFAVQNSSGVIDYTRAGDFSTDANNFLVTSAGQQVLGYPAVDGVVNTGAGVAPLQLGAGTISPPTATGNVDLTANLNAAAGVGSTFSTPVTIYDSLGASHTLTYNFTNTAPNTWSYSLSIPPADLNTPAGGPAPTGVLATGTLTFNGNGVLTGDGGGTGAPVYAVGNTGNGTVSGLAATAATVPQTITMTATSRDHLHGFRFGFRGAGNGDGGNSVHFGTNRSYDCGGIDGVCHGRYDHGADDCIYAGGRQSDSHYRLRGWRLRSDIQLECTERNESVDRAGGIAEYHVGDQPGWQQQRFPGEFRDWRRRHDYRVVQQRQNPGTGTNRAGEFCQRQRAPARRHDGLFANIGFRSGSGRSSGSGQSGNALGRIAGVVERGYCHGVREPDCGAAWL